MNFTPAESAACERLARMALEEDLGQVGDLTSEALIPADLAGQAVFVARPAGVIAGLPAAAIVCQLVDSRLVFEPLVSDGTPVEPILVWRWYAGRCVLSSPRKGPL